MNSPYEGKFYISQAFKGSAHDGLDLVGVDSKDIHATANGKIIFAGWENPNNHYQGFGQYVVIQDATGKMFHFGHLSEIKCNVGDIVKITDVIGVEGNTGHSTGSHCHYCVRTSLSPGTFLDVNAISGIPNVEGATYDDGYRPNQKQEVKESDTKKSVEAIIEIEGHKYSGLLEEV